MLIPNQRTSKLIRLRTEPVPQGPIKFGRSKPTKSSSLRRTIKINDSNDNPQETSGDAIQPTSTSTSTAPEVTEAEEDTGVPLVVRPGFGRSVSSKKKRISKLSFGASEGDTEDGGNDTTTTASSDVVSAPSKKSLSQRVAEKNALRKSALTARFGTFGADEEKPRYSKEYLEELQSSTPAKPQNLASLSIIDDDDDDSLKTHSAPLPEASAAPGTTGDAMDLDPSELDGAMIVQSRDMPLALTGDAPAAHVLTEAEIRERKERRARLAKEHDFIALDDSDHSDNDDRKRITLSLNKKAKKSESRLIAEDEDLGEGYDEFVTDGSLALGRKAEREAAKRHRQEMAEMIQAAEAGSDAESDDSEAEWRAAYEAAQRRAGMDGLHKPEDDLMETDEEGGGGGGVGGVNQIPKMKPLPELGEVLARMKGLVQGLEDEVSRRKARIESLEREKEEILTRETEVQEILNQAGAKYQAVMGGADAAGATAAGATVTAVASAVAASGAPTSGDALKFVTQSPLRPLPPGLAADLAATSKERGLESFGTPTQEKGPDDIDTEMAM